MSLSRRSFLTASTAALSVLAFLATAQTARVLRDVKYGRAFRQGMDVYLPATPQNAPILVMVHGGAWAFGDKRSRGVWEEKSRHWNGRGYIFISINYRMIPVADPLEQAADVARAIAFIQKNARGWGGDPGAMAVMGHSAGAHLVSLLGADPNLAARYGARPWRGTISLDTAGLDIPAVMQNRPARAYTRAFGDNPAFWRATSPGHQLKRGTAPFLLICSARRQTPCPAAQDFAAAVRTLGGRADVLPIRMTHGQINKELGKPGAYTAAVDKFLRKIGLP